MQNGCTVGSSRKYCSLAPNARATSSESSCCASREYGPLENGSGRRRGAARDELAQRRLEPVEHGAHLVGLHAGLEVVEEHVVRVVGRREAGDVAVLELERAVEPRTEAREVVLGAGLRPGVDRLGGEHGHLGRELGRHPAAPCPSRGA